MASVSTREGLPAPVFFSAGCRIPARPNDYPVFTKSNPNRESAMKYLCLIYDDEKKLATMSQAEG